jgi:23S rRNA G2069 N7-methylase RlmK/C1962 C5-methylase RlmI
MISDFSGLPGFRVDVAASWRAAKERFAAVVSERDALREELADVQREREELQNSLGELRSVVQEKWEAERRCAVLYRERELHRARQAQRDPQALVH